MEKIYKEVKLPKKQKSSYKHEKKSRESERDFKQYSRDYILDCYYEEY